MYLLECLILLLGLILGPALALYPRLILSPKTSVTIPICSAFVLYVLAYLLKGFTIYTPEVVRSLCGAFVLIALLRTYPLFQAFSNNQLWRWRKEDLAWYFLALLIILPYMAKLGTRGFDNSDEIYSWNYWAIQHFLGMSPDFAPTGGSPYPQLFPIWLSYGYQLLGDFELALPIKAMLAVFPFSVLAMLLGLLTKQSKTNKVLGVLLVGLVVFGINIQQIFDHAYADPLMASSLCISLFCLFHFRQSGKNLWLVLTIICALSAAFTKQAALIYTFVALPLILLPRIWQQHDKRIWLCLAILAIGGTLWYYAEGMGITDNQGVIKASMKGREPLEQLSYAFNTYFIHNPLFLLLFALTSYICLAFKRFRYLYLFWLAPSLILWFLFGAYQLRLGMHIVLGCAFITLYSLSVFKLNFLENYFNERFTQRILLVASLCSVIFCTFVLIRSPLGTNTSLSPYKAGEISLYKYFGEDYKIIHEQMYDKDVKIWVPARYVYGLFYQHATLVEPNYAAWTNIDAKNLLEEFKREMPQFAVDAGPRVSHGPGAALLAHVSQQCPHVFEPITTGPNRYNYIVYKINLESLKRDACILD